jgi:general stress protein YciG
MALIPYAGKPARGADVNPTEPKRQRPKPALELMAAPKLQPATTVHAIDVAPRPKAKRGFAAMSPEKQRAIAAKGGASIPAHKRSFSVNRDLAAEAGRKGGTNLPAHKRAYSVDAQLASDAGRKGGKTRHRRPERAE